MFISYLGPIKCQNFDADFNSTGNKPPFSISHLDRQLANGKIDKRDWVIYSPSLGVVFCFPCRLFGNVQQNVETFRTKGFKDFHNFQRSFKSHEISKVHLENCLAYSTRQKGVETVDAAQLKQHQLEMQYWREVLQRVVSVIKLLASRGLAFRGSDELFGSPSNGNFLGIIELLAEYDPFLASHIENYGNKGRGMTLSCKCVFFMKL